ncbi:phage tail tape measure protein [Halobacteriovorax sp. GB3]|uniref:phage tail tape measure protein n=1 Tax=Halobacteriovorax sp. GB3 TaxID=2719615 RepID=UPI00235F32DB|nr:phage tail tape measure protein [Halobacteriovorax sp. GB3]MDD0852997.1 phage tail tape measure protein [Halobacteriovorax sp. GB3]
MSNKFPVNLTFNAIDGTAGTLKRINSRFLKQTQVLRITNMKLKKMRDQMKDIEKVTKKVSGKMTSFGKSMSLKATLPIAAFGVMSSKAFGDFEEKLLNVKGLLDNNSFKGKTINAGFKDISKKAKELVGELPIKDISQIGQSIFDSISAGVDPANFKGFVKEAGKLAVAGDTEISKSTDGMTSAMNAWAMKTKDASRIASVFFAAQKQGKTDIAQLSDGIGNLASVAAGAGLGFEETMAAVSTATTAGMKTASAYSSIKALISNVQKPTADARKEAKRLGIQFDATALQTMGLKKFLDQISNSGKANNRTFAKLFGSVEALGVAQSLAGNQSEQFSATLKVINQDANEATNALKEGRKANTLFAKGFNDNMNGQNKKLTLVLNKIKLLMINLGQRLKPIVISVGEKIAKALDFLNNNPRLAKFVAIFAGIVAVMGPLISIAGVLIALLPSLTIGFAMFQASILPLLLVAGKFLLIIGAVVAALYGLYRVGKFLYEKFNLGEKFDSLISKVKKFKDLIMGIGAKYLKKIGIDIESNINSNNTKPISNKLKSVTSTSIVGKKEEKTINHEVTIKDTKGNPLQMFKTSESSTSSLGLGSVMGGI